MSDYTYIAPPPTEPLDLPIVITLLDQQIRHWRCEREAETPGTRGHTLAVAYVDAYQVVRRWLTGAVLPP